MEGRVCVVGLGYIGLPTASLLATKGYEVRGVDVNPRTVETINRGEIHIAEPDLDVLVRSAVLSGQLIAAAEPAAADVFILAVPTPLTADHRPDVSFVEAATRAVAPFLAPANLVILESTSPVGTTERIGRWLAELRPDLALPAAESGEAPPAPEQVCVAHCPERVLPGRILEELVQNDRVVGGIDAASTSRAHDFYRTFVGGEIVLADARTAEMTKLTENAYRDVNIAFANELSMLCEGFGIDVRKLIELANHHPRVDILQPGPGVGGHCIPIDPWFIIDSAGGEARLLRTAREVNLAKVLRVVERAKQSASKLKDPVIACLGLAYKNDVDDLRESPSVEIAGRLAEAGAGRIWAVEPNIDRLPPGLSERGVELVAFESALAGADLLVALVRHREFLAVDPATLAGRTVIDTCGLLG